MAIIKSLAVGKAKGSAGQLTYTYVGGDTIMKGKVAFPKIPRTLGQMNLRVRWANIVNLWQTFEGDLHPSFEAAAGRTSDYNLFVGRNNKVPVFLTKQMAAAGGCVVAEYLVTEGSLPKITTEVSENGVIVSNINLGDLTIANDTTVSDLSEAIINNNEGWRYGDQVSAFVCFQTQNDASGVPYVNTQAFEITLSNTDATPLEEVLSDPIAFAKVNGKLGMSRAIDGAACYIHSRKGADGVTQVSSQNLIVTSNIASRYSDQASRDAAIMSYGGKLTAPFLTPNVSVELDID